jgi:hypothetical protein
MKIKPGQLVKIDPKKSISPENLTLSPASDDGIILYEKIDLESFPSYKDFIGYSKVFNNETLLVVSNKGRPFSFNKEKHWDVYDVYRLLYENKMYECFSHCLKKH